MLLVSPARVADRLSVASGVADYERAITKAVQEGTRAALAATRYPDPVLYSGVEDLFYVDKSYGAALKLRLSRAFVDSIDSIFAAPVAREARKGATGEGSVDLSLPENATVLTDGERGFLTVADRRIERRWIAVQHSGGLTVASDDVFDDVPPEMRDLALQYSLLALKSHRTLIDGDEFPFNEIQRVANTLTARLTRANPSAVKPSGTAP